MYTELADYFLSCINYLSENYSVDILIVRWPVNKEAPFKFNFTEGVKVISKQDYSYSELEKIVSNFTPDFIYCSGWMDKDYLKLCNTNNSARTKVLGLDNHWVGSIRQMLGVIYARFSFANYFTHCWVPGSKQYIYARKIGFSPNQIRKGFYSADVALFDKHYHSYAPSKNVDYPHRFIYVGRYAPAKGIQDLWKAFDELHLTQPNDWELWCLGTGSLEPYAHPKIKHFGFVQPTQLVDYIQKTGVFILPSTFEPWGVVVHEFAAAGFPLLCSNKVGAKEIFLEENKNGFVFESNNVDSILQALKKVINLSNADLNKMALESNRISKRITPALWSETLIAMIE